MPRVQMPRSLLSAIGRDKERGQLDGMWRPQGRERLEQHLLFSDLSPATTNGLSPTENLRVAVASYICVYFQ